MYVARMPSTSTFRSYLFHCAFLYFSELGSPSRLVRPSDRGRAIDPAETRAGQSESIMIPSRNTGNDVLMCLQDRNTLSICQEGHVSIAKASSLSR